MDLGEKLDEFLRERYYNELLKAVRDGEALVVDFDRLDMFDPVIADQLLEDPINTLNAFNDAATALAQTDHKIRVRIRNLPESRQIRIRNLRAAHMGKLLSVDAIVKSASEVKPQIYEVVFECPECSTKFSVIQETNIVQNPYLCEGCGRRGDFKEVEKKMFDVRFLTGIEPFEVTTGEQPGEITIFLKEDLTTPRMQKKTDPGSRLKIVGVLRELPKRIKGRMSTVLGTYIDANHVEPAEIEFEELDITEEDEKVIRELAADSNIYEKLKASIAPGIYGFDEIKEAITMQLFGGIPHHMPDGSRIRGNIHILLTGDPGVGKTQFLKLVSSVVPRGRYVSGSGVTGAGLCTSYDALITLADGSLVKIGDLVEEKMRNKAKEIKKGVFITDDNSLRILAFDQKNLRIRPMKITRYWKLKSPEKLIKIRTRTGKEIKVTRDNPIPIIENGDVIWKNAKDLKKGDFVASPRIVKCHTNSDNPIFEFLDKNARLINSEPIVSLLINKIKEQGTIRDFAREAGVHENSLYHDWRGNKAPTLNTLINIGTSLGVDIEDHLPDELILTQQMGHKINLPKRFTEDLIYLIGLIAGDGNIHKTKYGGLSIRFSSNDNELLEKFSFLSEKNFGVIPSYYKHPDRIPYLTISSKLIGKIAEQIGIPNGNKSHNLKITGELSRLPNNLISAYLRGLFDTDGYAFMRKEKGSNVVGLDTASKEFAIGIQNLLLRFGIISFLRKRRATLSYIRGREVKSSEKYSLEIRGLKNLRAFRVGIGFGFSEKINKLDDIIRNAKKADTNVDVIPNISALLSSTRKRLGISAKELYGYKNYSYEMGRRNISKQRLKELVRKMNEFGNNDFLKKLENLAYSDIFWDEIKDIEIVDGEEYVYDVTVEDEHSFVANGLIIHNTATVRKDEVLGTWVLEAGALILCNKGLISIDEFDKMSKDDQIAMHEATSVETVSIAKASIVATLPAQTAVLAGANPKLGRFDPFMPIPDQIQIPETLLSRFDLKFAIRDIPDKSVDERIADHIITSRTTPEVVEPVIGVNLLRKYIAFAKQIDNLGLTPDAIAAMKDFYVDMRNRYTGEEIPTVSITLRQYEALIRLAEASAKIRLDSEVRLEDAERAIRLVKYSLSQLGYDYETGRIDIDRMESGITASRRRKIGVILEIIDSLQKASGREISVEDVKAEAESQGIENADDIIERLKREGTIFEPRSGFIKKV